VLGEPFIPSLGFTGNTGSSLAIDHGHFLGMEIMEFGAKNGDGVKGEVRI
jgi:hypothetical protein